MTSADSMLGRSGLGRMCAACAIVLGGCAGNSITREPTLTPPEAIVAPYDQSRGEVLFAVVPFRNESGVSQIDPLVFSDRVVAALEEVRGIRCLPVNRTLEAMRGLKLTQISTPSQARQVAQAMGADGIIVGSLTAWEPYDPVIGVTVVLQARSGGLTAGPSKADPGLDPRALSRMATEPETVSATNFAGDGPTNTYSDNLDGKDHRVLAAVKKFAQGRSDPTAAIGWERYVKSMDLYQQFAAHHVVERLMESEKVRLGVTTPGTGGSSDGVSGRVSKSDNRPGG
jgi:hypothetical protein